jgi:hypothetical protein
LLARYCRDHFDTRYSCHVDTRAPLPGSVMILTQVVPVSLT